MLTGLDALLASAALAPADRSSRCCTAPPSDRTRCCRRRAPAGLDHHARAFATCWRSGASHAGHVRPHLGQAGAARRRAAIGWRCASASRADGTRRAAARPRRGASRPGALLAAQGSTRSRSASSTRYVNPEHERAAGGAARRGLPRHRGHRLGRRAARDRANTSAARPRRSTPTSCRCCAAISTRLRSGAAGDRRHRAAADRQLERRPVDAAVARVASRSSSSRSGRAAGAVGRRAPRRGDRRSRTSSPSTWAARRPPRR